MFIDKSSFRIGWFCQIIFLSFAWGLSLIASELNLEDKINMAHESFLDVYYELLKNHHFGIDYQHNLIIPTDIDGNFEKSGIILLGLIEHLQRRQDFDSKFLLGKLNNYMSLKMHSFIASIDIPKAFQGNMWASFYTLYDHKISLSADCDELGVKDFYPFRTTLSKTIISMQLILLSDFSHYKKKENLTFCLEIMKKELKKINQILGLQDQNIDELCIVDFVKFMESYALADQLVQPRSVKKVIVISLLVIACIALVVIIAYKVAPNLPKSWEDFKNKVFELFRGIGKSASEGVIDAGVDRYAGNKETVQRELNQVLGSAIERGMGPAMDRVVNGQQSGDPAGGQQPAAQVGALVPGAPPRGGLAAHAAHNAGYQVVDGAIKRVSEMLGLSGQTEEE